MRGPLRDFGPTLEADNNAPAEGASITPPATSNPTMTLSEAKEVFTRWLLLPDSNVIDFMFGVAIANRFDGDPVWGGIVGPSGDGKTELLRTLEGHKSVMFISTLTEKALNSGYITEPGEADPSLLSKLNNKLMVTKELTPLLTGNGNTRSEVLGQLRDAYDGTTSKAFGTGKVNTYKAKFGFLFGVTPIIETSLSFNSSLGERFLYYRTQEGDSLGKINAALRNTETHSAMRSELNQAGIAVLNQKVGKVPTCDATLLPILAALADLMARARSSVNREGRSEDVLIAPSTEIGTRLVGQFIRLGHGIAAANQESLWGENLLPIIHHVAKSGIPSMRLRVIEALYKESDFVLSRKLGQIMRMQSSSAKRFVEDLWFLGLVERADSDADKWALSELARDRIELTGVFNS